LRRSKLLVLLTVDTEIWPFTPNWRERGLEEEVARYIDGVTESGSFGVPYQLERLSRSGLKGVFFVESLFMCEVGPAILRRIVSMVQERGHDVELHLHTEWLARMSRSILPGRTGQNMRQFTEAEQTTLIARGLENLRACGAGPVSAFRAGNFGANHDTLRAVARNGIPIDTSLNASCLRLECDLATSEPVYQPGRMGGVYEFPVTNFRDFPGHFRPAQLCAASSSEMERMLEQAWERGWHSFVWVSHGFELLKRRIRPGRPSLADRIAVRRFDRLCDFLAANRDRFQTVGFGDIDLEAIPGEQPRQPLRSGLARTAARFAEQALSQII